MADKTIIKLLERLGLRKIKLFELDSILKQACGDERAKVILDTMDSRAEGQVDRSFYSMKNTTLTGSLVLSSFFEFDYYVNLLSHFKAHPDYIGETVLDIGCDCGILSCAIAIMFPDTKVTGIDRCRNAISCAEELARKNGVNNVSFVKSDFLSYESSPFKTILSSKMAHEAIKKPDWPLKADIMEFAQIQKNQSVSFAKKAYELCEEKGHFISIERFGIDPQALGYLYALSEVGFSFPIGDISSIYNASQTTDCGNIERYPFFLGVKSEDSNNEESTYYAFIFSCAACGLDFTLSEYLGWEAQIVAEYRSGDFVYGFNLFQEGKPFGRISVRRNKEDPTCLIAEQVFGNYAHCSFHDISIQDDLISEIDANLEPICNNYHVTAEAINTLK